MSQTQNSAPVNYMQRMRDYYLALGYNNPYQWAHNADVPFQALTKPVRASRIGLVTTAAPSTTLSIDLPGRAQPTVLTTPARFHTTLYFNVSLHVQGAVGGEEPRNEAAGEAVQFVHVLPLTPPYGGPTSQRIELEEVADKT